MSYFERTIESLDQIIDDIENNAKKLYQSQRTTEAGDLREARKIVKSVRDQLLARDHDMGRQK